MELVAFAFAFLAAAAALAACTALHRTRQKLAEIERAVADIRSGNGCRRILARPGEPAAALVYEINDIVQYYEGRLAALQTAQEANRQLMTSLSHDVRTPLTTLIGALDAAHRGLLTGQAREESLDAARRKAHELKDYVDALFDWFKLNSGEFALHPHPVEAVELTRNFLADWVPLWEEQGMDYRLLIPEGPFRPRRLPADFEQPVAERPDPQSGAVHLRHAHDPGRGAGSTGSRRRRGHSRRRAAPHF